MKALKAARLLTATQSISLDKKDRLLPDLVLVSEDNSRLVVIELKRDRQTERQTVTELLGYEQELKNHLPFLSDFDLSFVVVATEFSPLLDHSLAQMVGWEQRRILCLRLDVSRPRWKLHLHLPGAWTDLGFTKLPSDALDTVTLSLYAYEGNDVAESVGRHVPTALQLIAREGDIHRSSGFALAWRSTSSGFPARWFITICVLNSFAFQFPEEWPLKVRRGALREALMKLADDNSSPDGLYAVARRAKRFLGRFCTATLESLLTWEQIVHEIEGSSSPVEMEFWGHLGEHVREFVTNPIVRRTVLPTLNATGRDWRDPGVGLPLIRRLSGQAFFADNKFSASGLFRFGVLMERAVFLCLNAERCDEAVREVVEGQLAWVEADILGALSDVVARCTVAKDIRKKPPRLRLPLTENLAESAKSLKRFIKWFERVFLARNAAHHGCFVAGRQLAAFVSQPLSRFSTEAQFASLRDAAQGFVADVFRGLRKNEVWVSSLPDEFQALAVLPRAKLKKALVFLSENELRNLVLSLVEALDAVHGPVAHVIEPVEPYPVDVEWFKARLEAQVASGNLSVALVVSPEGYLRIGRLPFAFPRSRYKSRVPMVNDLSAVSVVTWKTWKELRAQLSTASKKANRPITP